VVILIWNEVVVVDNVIDDVYVENDIEMKLLMML